MCTFYLVLLFWLRSEEALFDIFHTTQQIQFHTCIGFTNPIPTFAGSIPILFPRCASLLPCQYISFLLFSSAQRYLHNCAGLLTSFLYFLHSGIKCSCAQTSETSFPWDCIHHFLRQVKVCFLKIKGLNFVLNPVFVPWDHECYQTMITETHAATYPDLPDEIIWVSEQKVK